MPELKSRRENFLTPRKSFPFLQGSFLICKMEIAVILKSRAGGISLAIQWLRLRASMQGVWVPPLSRELRFYMPSGSAKKIKKKKNNNHGLVMRIK